MNDDAIKDVLTLREKDILRWSSEGKTAEEIALLMGVSERTINFHIGNRLKSFLSPIRPPLPPKRFIYS